MGITTITSRKFNQDVSKAKKAALNGPVIITDRGKPAHVLMSIEEYKSITGKKMTLIEMLDLPGSNDIDFNPPHMESDFFDEISLDPCSS